MCGQHNLYRKRPLTIDYLFYSLLPGEHKTIDRLVVEDELCKGKELDRLEARVGDDSDMNVDMEPGALHELIHGDGFDGLLLDVREPFEFDLARIKQARSIPLGELQDRLEEIADFRVRPVVVMCHHGPRGYRAIDYLRAQGFKRLLNLAGGIDAWSREVDASVPRY